MSIEEEYKKKNIDVQQYIKSEMKNIEKGVSEKNFVQLSIILNELEKTLNNKCLSLTYPRIIVDTWNFQDKLGKDLLDLAELYKHWK